MTTTFCATSGRSVSGMGRKTINREVTVTGYHFANRARQSFPSQIEFDNQRVTFAEAGMRYLVKKGRTFVKLFDVSDGSTTYRLRYDPDQVIWTLVHTTPEPRGAGL